jgi:5,10-methylenetetrahydromethanopterin reductase
MTATEGEIREKIATLRDAGYTQFTVQLIPGQEAALADWARIKAAFS